MKPSDFDLSKSQWEHLIDEYIFGTNGERDREILKGAILYGKTYERLAEDFDISPELVKKIVHKRRNVLFKHI